MSPEPVVEPLVDVLVQTTFRITTALIRVGAEHDLSLTQLRVLGILRDHRVRVTELAAHLGLDKSTMSGLIDRAEKRGLVRRERNAEDRRAVDVMIAPAGLALAETAYREVTQAVSAETGRLDPAQADELAGLLRIMLSAPQAVVQRP
ncbi:MarR family transcriptional regulator [Kineosporia sp. J2-2]|uniref:MarR family transcriptional regulator n=1 Tax=Kineosporia corallincola TaxID=2835133 RepID=A0ABS5TQB6_9ACTN|nr:MarR family transcriptional regulator [Kineosporia corallincola]MBT0773200.1 MarR family transcriptional regulator [Kineosporia corallincola]